MAKELKAKAPKVSASNDVETGKVCAALAYFLIGIIWYFVDENMKKNSFAKYHVKQGIVSFVFGVAFCIVFGIIFGILMIPLMFIPFIGIVIFGLLRILFLIPLIIDIIGLVYAIQGKEKPLPFIGQFADKFNI